MPSFPKPSFPFSYDVATELAAIRQYRDTKPGRQIPAKAPDRLLLATWNIANLGLQERRDQDYQLLAELIGWFDLVALQEVNDNLQGLRAIQQHLPAPYRALFSDRAGNDERLAFLYDTQKVTLLEKVGEVGIPPKEVKDIELPGIQREFGGFDRSPYLAAFAAGAFRVLLVNVHLYFGDDKKPARERRALEAYAVARWADLRQKDKHAYVRDIIALGDFNLPKVEPGDLIYAALRRRGLRRPEHSTRIGSSIAEDKDYDQIMFFPGQTREEFTGRMGIFDFDGAIFRRLWEARRPTQFLAYLRYYISDHRLLWAEFRI